MQARGWLKRGAAEISGFVDELFLQVEAPPSNCAPTRLLEDNPERDLRKDGSDTNVYSNLISAVPW